MATRQSEIPGAMTSNGRDERTHLELDHPSETRRSFKTTEFFAFVAGVAALLIAGYANEDSLNAFRTWMLVTILASAYMVSRGIAKAGSYERRSDVDVRDRY
jgi:hypothetical protein